MIIVTRGKAIKNILNGRSVMGLILRSVSFNVNGDPTVGSLHCRKDGETPIYPVSGLKDGKIHSVGVFVPRVLGVNIIISIEVENTEDQIINAVVKASEVTAPLLFGDVNFLMTPCPPKSITKLSAVINTVYFKGMTDEIRFFEHRWKWTYTGNDLCSHDLTETTEDIYIIGGVPLLPWDVSVQAYSPYNINYVWTSLLDICCQASYQFNQTYGRYPNTPEEYISIFTWELNANPAFCYDTRIGDSYYTLNEDTIKLQKYINDRSRFVQNKLNCYDCASLIQIECLACGVNADNVIMQGNGPAGGYFDTNPIIAIGCTDWAIPFSGPGEHGGFAYHAVATIDPNRDQNTRIWDACLKLDAGDYPGLMPGAVPPPNTKDPQVALGEIFAETGNDVVNVPPNIPYTGDFYRERLVCHGWNCNIQNMTLKIAYIDTAKTLQNKTIMKKNEWIENVKKRFGLEKNPLSKRVTNSEQNQQKFLSDFLLSKGCRLMEDYERNQVYEWQSEGTVFRVEFIVSLDEEEAYNHLLNLLACIANPNVVPANVGDLSFRIDDIYYVFIKNNILVRVSNETEESDASAENIAHIICNSL